LKLYERNNTFGVVIIIDENKRGLNDWAPKNNFPPQKK